MAMQAARELRDAVTFLDFGDFGGNRQRSRVAHGVFTRELAR